MAANRKSMTTEEWFRHLNNLGVHAGSEGNLSGTYTATDAAIRTSQSYRWADGSSHISRLNLKDSERNDSVFMAMRMRAEPANQHRYALAFCGIDADERPPMGGV